MDYQKQQAEQMMDANTLKSIANRRQADANELQQQMIDEIKTNNRVTSKHNTAMKWLTVAIVLLAGITLFTNLWPILWPNYKETGRYAITSGGLEAVRVLDTKTSQMWLRTARGTVDLGTSENPKLVTSSDLKGM